MSRPIHQLPPAAPPKPAASIASGTASSPIDLSGSCPRLTAEERVCHMTEGWYYRYGRVGHVARQCPVRTAGKPMQAAMQAAATARKDTEVLN